MWIVLLALRRPYTFVVAALLLIILTPFILLRTPTDIFPAINIPVVSIIWQYTGLDAKQMEQRIVYRSRTRADRDGQQHRAHRVHFLQRHRRHQGLSSAESFRGFRRGANHRGRPNGAEANAAGHDAAAHHPIQRLDGADFAIQFQQPEDVGAGVVRRDGQSGPRRSGRRAGRDDSVALRRQEPGRGGGFEPARAQGQEHPGAGRHQRHQRAKSRAAQRHGENRPDGIFGGGGCQRAFD